MCPNDQLLTEYLDNELEEPWLSQVLAHIEWCSACKQNLERLRSIKEATQKASLEEEKISASEARVLNFMEKNVFNKEKQSWKRKLLNITKKKVFWPILSAVVTFCFCLIIWNPTSDKNNIPCPEVTTSLNIDNIVPVRSADNYTTAETLKKYSLEEILQYLDDSGYEVTIRNKGLVPLGETEVHTIIVPEVTPQEIPFKIYLPFKFNFGKSE